MSTRIHKVKTAHTTLFSVRVENDIAEIIKASGNSTAFIKDAIYQKIERNPATKAKKLTGSKVCCRCKLDLPAICYQKDKTNKDGHAPHCKNCEAIKKLVK